MEITVKTILKFIIPILLLSHFLYLTYKLIKEGVDDFGSGITYAFYLIIFILFGLIIFIAFLVNNIDYVLFTI
jgi:hypothetical protein